jgi:hypothetical protein
MKGGAPLRSVVEWGIAAAVLLGLGWFSFDIARTWIARTAEPEVGAIVGVPAGVPPGATSVPLLMLLDGREIRTGMTQADLNAVLGAKRAVGEPHRSEGAHGERVTRAYVESGTRFFITIERAEAGGPMRVAGIYLP